SSPCVAALPPAAKATSPSPLQALWPRVSRPPRSAATGITRKQFGMSSAPARASACVCVTALGRPNSNLLTERALREGGALKIPPPFVGERERVEALWHISSSRSVMREANFTAPCKSAADAPAASVEPPPI